MLALKFNIIIKNSNFLHKVMSPRIDWLIRNLLLVYCRKCVVIKKFATIRLEVTTTCKHACLFTLNNFLAVLKQLRTYLSLFCAEKVNWELSLQRNDAITI